MTHLHTLTTDPASPDRPRIPSVEVMGTATRQQAPSRGQITVTVTGKGQNRETAWDLFQKAVQNLHAALEDVASVGNAVPTEDEEEVTRVLRSATEISVTADVTVSFAPAQFGQVLAALIDNDLPYSTPVFDFDRQPEVTPEMLTEAAADARVRAQAIAAGVGGTVGRLVAINVGPPQAKPVLRNFEQVNYLLSSHAVAFDTEKMRTFDTVAQVTCEFEIIETQVAA